MCDNKMKSILIGNGLDIQLGGDDYLNKWVIIRLMAKAKMLEYDALFKDSEVDQPTITGNEIVQMFENMIETSNKARTGEYDKLVEKYGDKNIKQALEDFKRCHKISITSVEQIGMEDWLLILRLLIIQQGEEYKKGILETEQIYESAKAGFDRMILDSLYCEGDIQKLSMSEQAKAYFDSFDNIFTLNYDNTMERQIDRVVFHLHGDFSTKMHTEDPDNAIGYIMKEEGENVWVPSQFEHCLCNGILDYSGKLKYERAKFFIIMEGIRAMATSRPDSMKSLSGRRRRIMQTSIDKSLPIGCDYHFADFEALTGELTIIGISPQNDSHIFSCINNSNIEKVIFYRHCKGGSETEIKLPIDKPYAIKDIGTLWDEINIPKRGNSATYKKIEKASIRNPSVVLGILNTLNSIYRSYKAVTVTDVVDQIKTIPVITEKVLIKMLSLKLSDSKNHKSPDSVEELITQLFEFGQTIKIAGISPQAFYSLYLVNKEYKKNFTTSKNTKGTKKAKKRKRKR